MAIDSARKRASALGAYKPFCFYIVPTGTMAKATDVHQYEGISASPPDAPDQPLPQRNSILTIGGVA